MEAGVRSPNPCTHIHTLHTHLFCTTGPILVRLAWHASGTYDKSDGSGGCNGASMRQKPEMDDPENAGLDIARNKLEGIKKKYDKEISYADLWIFASYIAIEAMGGPYIPFSGGRSDEKPAKMCPAHGRLPSAEGDAKHIRAIFNRMGFNDQEIVVLIGGGHVYVTAFFIYVFSDIVLALQIRTMSQREKRL